VTIDGKDIDKFRLHQIGLILNITQKNNPYDIKLGSHKAKINAIMPIIKPLPPAQYEI
jgi:hypothetical protein